MGDQAGAPFEGEWQKWQGNIQFDANNLAEARFDVRVDTQSPFTNDDERDNTIRSPEFFDVAKFKEARFTASEFDHAQNGFTANGALQVKGLSYPVSLAFTVEQTNDKFTLKGSASLDRLLLNIGTGDWTDTSWVGQTVQVNVKVVTK